MIQKELFCEVIESIRLQSIKDAENLDIITYTLHSELLAKILVNLFLKT